MEPQDLHILILLAAAAFLIAGLVAWILILIDAFQDAIWKGLLFFLCGFYGLYYAFFEFENDNKWLIVILAIAGSGISAGLLSLLR